MTRMSLHTISEVKSAYNNREANYSTDMKYLQELVSKEDKKDGKAAEGLSAEGNCSQRSTDLDFQFGKIKVLEMVGGDGGGIK